MTKELWEQMTFSQKITWLIQYYGLTVLAVIVTIAVVISLIVAFVNAGNKGDMRIIILDNGVSSELCDVYRDELEELIAGDVEIASYLKVDPNHMQAFFVRLQADDLDIVIAPEEEICWMAEEGYLLPYDANGITSFYDQFPEELYITANTNDSNEELIYGIRFGSESRYMTYRREAGADEAAMCMGVTIKRINDVNVNKTALYLLEK